MLACYNSCLSISCLFYSEHSGQTKYVRKIFEELIAKQKTHYPQKQTVSKQYKTKTTDSVFQRLLKRFDTSVM